MEPRAIHGHTRIDSSTSSAQGAPNDTIVVSMTSADPIPTRETDTTPKPLTTNPISAITDTSCIQAVSHTMGVVCDVCRTILMPWFDALPQALEDDENNTPILKAPDRSILGRVNLGDPEAIAVVAVVAGFDVANKRTDEVKGLLEAMKKFPRAVKAGYRVAHIYRFLFKISAPAHDIPSVVYIISSAMKDPHRTPDEYISNLEIELANVAPLRPHYGARPSWVGAKSGGASISKKSASSTDGLDDLRADVQGNQTHRPPRGGPWEFVPGTVLDHAVVGIPAPQKCFLTRQSKADPSIKDVRQYPQWASIDWNDPNDVHEFNKWLEQNIRRVNGRVGTISSVWTQAEKDVLKQTIKAGLARGKTRKTIDWDEVAQTLFDHFKDITQHAGDPLAQKTKLHPDNTIGKPKQKFAKKLGADRIGSVYRSGKTVKLQTMKYADIALLLRHSVNYKPRGIRPGDSEEESSDESDDSGNDADGDDGQDDTPIKTPKRKGAKAMDGSKSGSKRRRNRSPDTPSKASKRNKTPPSPTPVMTDAEKFASQVSKIPKSLKDKMKKPNVSAQLPVAPNFYIIPQRYISPYTKKD